MIPSVFHFAYYRGTKNFVWRDIHTLCLRSCRANTGIANIVVHYDAPGAGTHWDEARALPGIEWRLTDFAATINGYDVTDQRIICDMYRLRTLEREGGFFADLDFVFLGSFESLRHNEALIGTQCRAKKKLACGLMGCVPGAAFIRAYIAAYDNWTPKEQIKFWNYANSVPWALSSIHPVTVVPRPAFYPWCWSNRKFLAGAPINIKTAIAIHLWESLHQDLTVDVLKTTVIGPAIAKVQGQPAPSPVAVMPGRTLTFE